VSPAWSAACSCERVKPRKARWAIEFVPKLRPIAAPGSRASTPAATARSWPMIVCVMASRHGAFHAREMPAGHVAELVGHHPEHLPGVFRPHQQPGRDEEILAAGHESV